MSYLVRKIILLFCLLFWLVSPVKTQQAFELSILPHYGFIADVGNRNHLLIKSHILPFELTFSQKIIKDYSWKKIIPYVRKGVSFRITNLKNPDYLGYLFSLSPFIQVKLIDGKFYDLGITGLMGIMYSSKIYHRTDNYRNTLFSSHLNAGFGFGIENSFHLGKNLRFLQGFDFIHHSNGETSQPNDGANIVSLFAGFSYSFKDELYTATVEVNESKERWSIQFLPTFGWKQNSFYTDKVYSAASLSGNFLLSISSIQNIGAGVSLFYDNSIDDLSLRTEEELTLFYRKTTAGVHLIYEFYLYPLIIHFQGGYMVLDDNIPDRSLFYNRFGIKYFITNKIFFNLSHKSRFFFKGDNIEWGIGYSI